MEIELRAAEEIQAAHDRLTAIVLGEVPVPFEKRSAISELTLALDALCWVLKHEHNQAFGENLARIDAYMAARGIVLRDSGKLQVP